MKFRLAILLLLALPLVVSAQTDTILFFTGTTEAPAYPTEIYTTTPVEAVEIHLGLLDPSLSGISSWEASVDVEGMVIAPTWFVPGCGLIPECGMPPFQIGLIQSDPLEPGQLYLLATFTAFIMSPTDVVRFSISPVPGSVSFPDSPGYAGPAPDYELAPMTTIAGNEPVPVFTINQQTVSEAPASWGSVKRLYR